MCVCVRARARASARMRAFVSALVFVEVCTCMRAEVHHLSRVPAEDGEKTDKIDERLKGRPLFQMWLRSLSALRTSEAGEGCSRTDV